MNDQLVPGKTGSLKGGVRRLSDTERDRLHEIERELDSLMPGFFTAGILLEEVRDKLLFEEQFPTFQAYCQGRWGFSKQRAQQLMAGAKVVARLNNPATTVVVGESLSTTNHSATTVVDAESPSAQLPTNEAQVRELGRVPEEKQQQVWRDAVRAREGLQPTAKDIRAASGMAWPLKQPIQPSDKDIREAVKGTCYTAKSQHPLVTNLPKVGDTPRLPAAACWYVSDRLEALEAAWNTETGEAPTDADIIAVVRWCKNALRVHLGQRPSEGAAQMGGATGKATPKAEKKAGKS